MIDILALDHIVLNVADVEVSARWYETVLGLRRQNDPAKGRTSLHFGVQKINLRPVHATQQEWFTGHAPQAGSDDLCFVTNTHPDHTARHLRDHGVGIEVGPVTKQGARGPMTSLYCRDPDGNLVEVAWYG